MAYTFNGTTDKWVLADRPGFDTVDGTVACWFKTTMTAKGNMLRRDDGGSQRHFLLRTIDGGDAGKVQFQIIYGGNPDVKSSGTYNDGAWHHAAATWSWNGSTTTTITLYVDGSSQGTNTASAADSASAQAMDVGVLAVSSAEWYAGDLCEAAMWNAVLSAGEIASIAKRSSPLIVRPAALQMYIPMVRAQTDMRGYAVTVTGTTVAPHAPTLYPRGNRSLKRVTAVGGGGGFSSAFFRENAGLGVAGGGPFARANAGLGAVA